MFCLYCVEIGGTDNSYSYDDNDTLMRHLFVCTHWVGCDTLGGVHRPDRTRNIVAVHPEIYNYALHAGILFIHIALQRWKPVVCNYDN